jgi:hypothetical protein
MKKMFQTICQLFEPAREGAVALSNDLGGMFQEGKESFQIDPGAALPVSTRYLVYKRGTSQYYAAVGDAASLPLGISPDAPYQLGDFFDVERFGAGGGTRLGCSAGAITIDHLVGAAANGLVQDVTAAGNGTYWVIGRATKTVTAAGLEITFVSVAPYQVTVTGGAPFNYPHLLSPVRIRTEYR